ncbi:FAD-dependent oxidoreductase [Stratiformator vulcanicus]|uniref:Coenzyme A disulfide reductase n=1 Tax=Stratiformator vulcanicus TaxID=2527980 RepID=A0A517QZB0_9PLAN|nr:FAD-dependent oxidoreductase [Stratiformator vulcanicus]QDT36971.1 Coenzyme A disulfide reductase [Stratiformator vulcanicus]
MAGRNANAPRILIVGGVAGGASAATRARRCNESAEIVIFEKGPYVSFANCGLPYHVGGEIEDRDKLLVATPELFQQRFNIDVRVEHEVLSIDRENRSIKVRGPHGESNEPYDRLILSPGAEPIVPPFAKGTFKNVFNLWTMPDMDAILSRLGKAAPKRAVVVGAGFVGLEVVEQLQRRGLDVSLVEKSPHVLPPLDVEMARIVERELRDHEVDLHTGNGIAGLRSNDGIASAAVLDDETNLEADLFILSIGVRPRTKLAADAGLEIGEARGIRVNESMQTSDPNIYAVGDAVEYEHGVLHRPARVPLAGPANRAGRIAGEHAATGRSSAMASVMGTAVVRVFEKTVALTGISETMAKREHKRVRSAIIRATNHAGYFPGAEPLVLKLIYEEGFGRILGAQCVGGEGVDKRIDVIATAMHFGATVEDLAGLDLAYAPPFGSAKDPVHMAAFVAANDLDARPPLLPPGTVLDGYQVVDVRTASEIETLPLKGAVHIPIDELRERANEIDPKRPTVVVCHSAKRAHVGAMLLCGLGFQDVRNLTGGMSIRSLVEPVGESTT